MIFVIKSLKKFLLKHNTFYSILKGVFFALLIIIISGTSFYYFENPAEVFNSDVKAKYTYIDSIWWAFVTITTVGYGDYSPSTLEARVIAVLFCFIGGISLVGYLLGSVADTIMASKSKKRRGLMELKLEDHVLICYYPSMEKVREIILEIKEDSSYHGRDIVLVNDQIDELPVEFEDIVKLHFIKGNPSSSDVLKRANVETAKAAIVLARSASEPDSDNNTLAAVLMIEKLHPAIKTVAEVISKEKIELLENAGCDEIVSMETISSGLIVQTLQDEGVIECVNELVTNISGTTQFYSINVTNTLIGKKFCELRSFLARFNQDVIILGIFRGKRIILNPGKDEPFIKGDKIIFIAHEREAFDLTELEV